MYGEYVDSALTGAMLKLMKWNDHYPPVQSGTDKTAREPNCTDCLAHACLFWANGFSWQKRKDSCSSWGTELMIIIQAEIWTDKVIVEKSGVRL